MSELRQKGEECGIVAFEVPGLGDEHASRLAATVFDIQRHEASNHAAAAESVTVLPAERTLVGTLGKKRC